MKSFLFSTGNSHKFLTAQSVCSDYGITIEQKKMDVEEIQGEDSQQIAIRKAESAYAIVKQPILISDDSWSFTGLNGFPGAYMHSMNHWLSSQDFLRLTLPLKNRQVFLIKYLVYYDGKTAKIFEHTSEGKLLTELKGSSTQPCHEIIAMDGDDGLSVAQVYQQGVTLSDRPSSKIWHDFAKWFIAQ